jgi:hypothetical protein
MTKKQYKGIDVGKEKQRQGCFSKQQSLSGAIPSRLILRSGGIRAAAVTKSMIFGGGGKVKRPKCDA